MSLSYSCLTNLTNFSPYSTCSGLIEYPHGFYLANGQTLDDLETQVRGLLYGATLSLGNNCTSSLKKLACAMVYQPCVIINGVPATNPVTSLPYVQPCTSLCTTAYSSAVCPSTTLGQAEAQGYALADCASTTTFNSNSQLCWDMSYLDNKKIVSDPVEVYQGNVCKGIREEIYILDSYLVSSQLGSLLPPLALQSIIESQFSASEVTLPQTFSSACLNIQKQLFCAENFPTAGTFNLGPHLQNTIVFVPQFPRFQDCETYLEVCAALLSNVPADSPLRLNCSAVKSTGSGTIALYPKTKQAVAVVFSTPVYSYPYNISEMGSQNIETVCPNGFSVMADPTAKGQVVVTDGCALNCPAPIFTSDDQNTEFHAQFAFAWLNTFFIVIQLVHMFTKREENRNVFLIINFAATFIYMAYDAIQRSVVAPHPKMLTCASDTEWYVMDGDTGNYQGGQYANFARSCQTFAALYLYMEFIFFATVLCVLAELWTRVHMPSFDLTKYRVIYGGIAFVWAFANGFLVNFYNNSKMLITGAAALECRYQLENHYTDVYAHYVPFLIVWGFVAVFGLHTAFTLIHRYATDHSEFVKTWSENYTVALYLLAFFVVYGPIIIWHYIFINAVQNPETINSTTDWTECIFSLFVDASSQSTVDAVCGTLPGFTVAPAAVLGYTFLPLFYNFFVMLVTHDRDTWHFWTHFGASRLLDGPDQSGKPNAVAADNTGKLEEEEDGDGRL